MTASILYELPFKFENNLVETIAGGWQLGSIITISTGTPNNGGNCGDMDGNEQGNRGDATGVSPFLDNPTNLEFFRKDPSGRGAAAINCNVPMRRAASTSSATARATSPATCTSDRASGTGTSRSRRTSG